MSTLPAKINHHCLLLATRKSATTKPPAPGAAGGVCSFAATPVSRGTTLTYRSAHHVEVPTNGSMSGPPSDSGRFSQPALRDAAAGGGTGASRDVGSVWGGAGHTLSVTTVGGGGGRGGWASAGHDGAGEPSRSVSGGGGSNGELYCIADSFTAILSSISSCHVTAFHFATYASDKLVRLFFCATIL